MRRCHFVLLLVIGAVAAAASRDDDIHDLEQLAGFDYVLPGWYIGLDDLREVSEIHRASETLRDAPLYVRLSVGRWLISALTDETVIEMAEYEPLFSHHDLRRVAGRAAYYLEEAFPIDVATISKHTSAATLSQIENSCRKQFTAYRSGILEVVEQHQIGSDTMALGRAYRDAIYAGVPEASRQRHSFLEQGAAAFESMLHAFSPIGKTLVDLESIMGAKAYAYDDRLAPRKVSDNVTGVFLYDYSDQQRMFGKGYFFLVEDGVITAVNVRPFS